MGGGDKLERGDKLGGDISLGGGSILTYDLTGNGGRVTSRGGGEQPKVSSSLKHGLLGLHGPRAFKRQRSKYLHASLLASHTGNCVSESPSPPLPPDTNWLPANLETCSALIVLPL